MCLVFCPYFTPIMSVCALQCEDLRVPCFHLRCSAITTTEAVFIRYVCTELNLCVLCTWYVYGAGLGIQHKLLSGEYNGLHVRADWSTMFQTSSCTVVRYLWGSLLV